MDEIEELIQRTEALHDQVETMQQMLQQMAGQIRTHLEVLRRKQGDIRKEEEMSIHDAPTLLLSELRADDPEAGPGGNGSDSNRRHIPRHKGNPVPVLISQPQREVEPVQGWVIDRSPDGLCLVADEALDVGALVNVRPVHHRANPNWYPIEVWNCRPERDIWILGCQFVRKLSWGDLRLFS
jgi:hypothetical protein